MNEISSVEKRVNFHFQSSKGNMRSGSGQQSSPNAGRREEYDEKEELKLVKSSLSGDLSCDSMVVNKPPDAVSATRSGFSLHLATVQEAKVAAAQAAAKSVEEEVVSFSGDVSSDVMVVNSPPNIVSVATRSELSLHRAAVTEVAAHRVEDQVATQWSEDGPSEDVLFGERSGSYSTTSGRITSVTLATVQALDTVQEAVSVAEIARFSYCPCSKSKADYRMQIDARTNRVLAGAATTVEPAEATIDEALEVCRVLAGAATAVEPAEATIDEALKVCTAQSTEGEAVEAHSMAKSSRDFVATAIAEATAADSEAKCVGAYAVAAVAPQADLHIAGSVSTSEVKFDGSVSTSAAAAKVKVEAKGEVTINAEEATVEVSFVAAQSIEVKHGSSANGTSAAESDAAQAAVAMAATDTDEVPRTALEGVLNVVGVSRRDSLTASNSQVAADQQVAAAQTTFQAVAANARAAQSTVATHGTTVVVQARDMNTAHVAVEALSVEGGSSLQASCAASAVQVVDAQAVAQEEGVSFSVLRRGRGRLSKEDLFGERSGSYSTTIGRITSVTPATVQALDTVQEAVRVSSYCPFSKSKVIEVNSGVDKAATLDRVAEDSKFGKRPSGNITLEGDGVGYEDSGNKQRPEVNTELESDAAAVTAEALEANSAAHKAIVEAKCISADGPEAKIKGSTAVQQPSSDMDSAVGKVGVVATAMAAETAGDKPTASNEVKLETETDASSTVEPLSANTAVADKAMAAETAGDKPTASNEVKLEAEADASKAIGANSRVPLTADEVAVAAVDVNSEAVVRDMNSNVGVAVSATVTVNVNADTQNVDGMNSAEVGAAAEVAGEAAEVAVTSIVTVAGNTVTQVVSACQERAAKVAKTNDKRPSGNITLEGDGGGFEDSKDQTRPDWTATSTVTEAVKSGNEKNRVLSKTEQHLTDTQAGNKQKFDVPMNTELESDAAATSANANVRATGGFAEAEALAKEATTQEAKVTADAEVHLADTQAGNIGCSKQTGGGICATVREASRVSRVEIALAFTTEHTQEHTKTDTACTAREEVATNILGAHCAYAKAAVQHLAAVPADGTTMQPTSDSMIQSAIEKTTVGATGVVAPEVKPNAAAVTVEAPAKANAVLKATAATVEAPEVKLKATSTVEPKVGTTSEEAKFENSIPEANQVNFDVVAAEANFKIETDEEFESSVVADQASVEATCKYIPADGPEIKRLCNRMLGAALNTWRDEYEQVFELSNLQLLAQFCWTYRTLAEGFRTWEDTTVRGRAECNRRVWSLQHWAYRQLSIAFDAWRQCLVKAQAVATVAAQAAAQACAHVVAVAQDVAAQVGAAQAEAAQADAKGFQFGGKPRGISTTVGREEAAELAPRESATARQAASCEVEGATSPAYPAKAEGATKLSLDTRSACAALEAKPRHLVKTGVDSRYACTALEAAVTDKVSANTRQADEVDVNRAYTAQVVAAQSTAAGHGTSADDTAMQPASVTNSMEVLNVDGVPPRVSVVTSSVVTFVAAQVAGVADHAVAARAVAAQAVVRGVADGVFPPVSPLVVADHAVAARAVAAQAVVRGVADGVFPPVSPLVVADHAVATRAVAAQAVVRGVADGVFPPVSPLALQPATSSLSSCRRLWSLSDERPFDTRATCTALEAVDSRSTGTALEEAVAHNLAKVAVAAVADKVSASTRHADEMAVNSTYTAQVVAAQSTVAVHGTSADGTTMQLASSVTNSMEVLKVDGVSPRSPCATLEEAVAHYRAKGAVTDKVSAYTRQSDEVAVDEVVANSACVYTAQVVAAQSTVAVHGTSAGGTSMQPESVENSTEVLKVEGVSARAAAAQDEAQDTTVEGVFPLNTAKVDAQCESAKEVQSNEDEAKVEHVEAKAVATASLALVSTAEVLGTPEQHACRDQSMDRNDDGVQIASQREIWATHRRSIVVSEAKSLHQADAEACMEALEDPSTTGVVFSPALPRGAPDNHPESDYLMALGDEVSNNRHISGMIAGLAIAIAVFLLRIEEFAVCDKRHMEDSILLRQDVTFFWQGQLCAWHHPTVDAVEVFIRCSKTDQHKQGCRRMQYLSGDATLCQINGRVEWLSLTEGSRILASATLLSVKQGREGVEWSVLTEEAVSLLMKGAAVVLTHRKKWVATHSIRIAGATTLLTAGVPSETVQIVGRGVSNAFIGYTRYQAELVAGISKRIVGTHYVVRPK